MSDPAGSTNSSSRLTRRSLLQAPLAGAAAAAVAVPAAAEAERPEDPRQPRLHLTEHVRAYYARARG